MEYFEYSIIVYDKSKNDTIVHLFHNREIADLAYQLMCNYCPSDLHIIFCKTISANF